VGDVTMYTPLFSPLLNHQYSYVSQRHRMRFTCVITAFTLYSVEPGCGGGGLPVSPVSKRGWARQASLRVIDGVARR